MNFACLNYRSRLIPINLRPNLIVVVPTAVYSHHQTIQIDEVSIPNATSLHKEMAAFNQQSFINHFRKCLKIKVLISLKLSHINNYDEIAVLKVGVLGHMYTACSKYELVEAFQFCRIAGVEPSLTKYRRTNNQTYSYLWSKKIVNKFFR